MPVIKARLICAANFPLVIFLSMTISPSQVYFIPFSCHIQKAFLVRGRLSKTKLQLTATNSIHYCCFGLLAPTSTAKLATEYYFSYSWPSAPPYPHPQSWISPLGYSRWNWSDWLMYIPNDCEWNPFWSADPTPSARRCPEH